MLVPPFQKLLVWYYYNKWMVFTIVNVSSAIPKTVGVVLLQQVDGLWGIGKAALYPQSKGACRAGKRGRAKPGNCGFTHSVKTPAFTGEEVGYDAGKNIKGRKRHLATDTLGNVMAVGVSAASVHDKTGALSLKDDIEDIGRMKKIIADGSYKGVPPFTAGGRIEWEIVEKKATGGRFKVLPKRWIVERTFAWLQNFRRLAKDYEKTITMAKAMIIMGTIVITLRKLIT